MTRVQRERFTDLMEYERVKNVYILRNKMLEHTRPNLRILHPLPRVNEIALDVDDNPRHTISSRRKTDFMHAKPFCAMCLALRWTTLSKV